MSLPDALKIEEVARRLQIDRRTVYRLILRGQLRAVRAGRLWRVPTESLQEYLRGDELGGNTANKEGTS